MTILVTGATGTVGSAVTAALAARGIPFRMTLRRAPAVALPAGAEAMTADAADTASLAAAFEGVETAFLLTPLSEDETRLGLNLVAAAEAAGVRRVVLLTVHRIADGAHIPHFRSKLPIIDAVKGSGMGWTLIEPNNFFQNDLFMLDAVRAGLYPQPIGGRGLSRVHVRDIADAAVIALTDDRAAGQAVPLVGPAVLTGEATAEIYAAATGRPVVYGGDDLEAWGRAAQGFMPAWLVRDLTVMYRYFQEQGLAATPEELAQVTDFLGRAPRSFEAFVGEATATPAAA